MSNAGGSVDDLTWEWTLASGETIVARVDPNTFVESVYVGQRLVSRSGRAGKPEGHDVPLASAGAVATYRAGVAQELRATFDPALSSFELRANGQVLAPSRAPAAPPRQARAGQVYGYVPLPRYAPSLQPVPRQNESIARRLVIALAAVGLVIASIAAGVRSYVAGARAPHAPAGALTASNGLVVAHYPEGFRATQTAQSGAQKAGRDDNCPARTCNVEASFLRIDHVSRDEGVMVAAFKTNGLQIGRDPWRVSNLLFKQFDELTKVRGADYVETERQDGTCFGQPGAVVLGRFRHKGEDGTMWSCTFIRDGNAYWVTSFVNVKNAPDAPELEKIILATEIK